MKKPYGCIVAMSRSTLEMMRGPRSPIWILAILGMFFATGDVIRAQTSSAQLSGFVLDSTGARLAGAKVTIVNTGTKILKETTTNEAAEYTFPSLLPGVYEVSASSAGFAVAKEVGVTLNVGDVRSLDFTLRVGQSSETVTITSSTQLMNTENSEVGQVINERQVLDIPLNGRNFEQLVTLGEGAYSTSGGASSQFRPQLGNSDLGFAGGRYNSVSYLIDGTTNRDVAYGNPILFPSVEALQEFKEQAGTYSAQYGGSAQQVNINFRSGTDQLHGSLYDFLRNESLNARSFLAGPRVPELRWNQFGYAAGGPVYIPKLYDGRGKTFFFANYEGLRQQANSPGYANVPDPAQLSGVFPTTITNPSTGLPTSNIIIDPQTKLPFPNNTIPADRISQFAKTYNKFFLAPNTSGSNGNYFGQVTAPISSDQQNYRVDENFNSRNSMFFRYSRSNYAGTSGSLESTGNSGQVIYTARVNAYQGVWTRTISSSLLNELRIGYIHTLNDRDSPLIDQADFNALGIKGAYTDITQYELPEVIFSGNGLTLGGTNINQPTIDRTWTWDGSDSLILTRGSHTFNIGFDYRNWKRTNGKGANLGQISFNGETTGNALADYLLGLPQNVTLPQPTPLATSASNLSFNFPQFSVGAYGEDQWKVTHRLSITSGLRYDFYSISREATGAWAWLDPTISGGGLCVGTNKLEKLGISNNLEHYCGRKTPNGAPKLQFAPRIGIAFQPVADGKTTVRAGYGVFFDTPEENDDVNIANIYPFFQNGSYTTVPGVSQVDLSTPFPTITTLQPVTSSQLGLVFTAPAKRSTYSSQWSLALEREVTRGTRLSASYLGSHTVHLQTRLNYGQPTYYDPANPSPFTAREPYQNFGLNFYGQSYEPNANYNAGTLKLQHNEKDLELLTSFTWSRSMDIRSGAFGVGNDGSAGAGGWAGPSDTYNLQRDYARSSFDTNKRFVASFVYELPIGRGKRLLGNASRLADVAVGGWQANGIATIQSGLPFSIYASDTNTLIGTYNQRANILHSPLPNGFHRSATEWFDTTAFAQPAPGIFGTSGRNILLDPYFHQWDLSLFKSFSITERLRLQLRGEAFNAFNRTNLGVPNTDVNSPTFGTINNSSPGRIIQVAGKLLW